MLFGLLCRYDQVRRMWNFALKFQAVVQKMTNNFSGYFLPHTAHNNRPIKTLKWQYVVNRATSDRSPETGATTSQNDVDPPPEASKVAKNETLQRTIVLKRH